MRNLKRLLASLTLAAGLSALLVVPTAQAAGSITLDGLTLRPAHVKGARFSAEQDELGSFVIYPVSDGSRCLDADLNTIGGNGTKVQLWTCYYNPGDQTAPANQVWTITQIPEGHLRLQNAQSGRYLDADLNTIGRNGTIVQLWDYVGGATNQWFDFTQIPEGYLRVQSVNSGRYLDADLNTGGRDGTIVQLWDYVGGATNQWWN